MDNDNQITGAVIGAAIEVHRELGPGLLESVYEACLVMELTERGVPFVRQQLLPVIYKSRAVDCGFRVDLFVADRVIVELKAGDQLAPIHDAQLLTYLRLTGCRVGLLLNFNVRVMRRGIRRLVLDQ